MNHDEYQQMQMFDDWFDGDYREEKVEEYFGHEWSTKDSGERHVTNTGYQRDTQKGKPRFDLLLALRVPFKAQFLTRVAALLARGAEKYDERNWEKANEQADLDRFQSSAFRHLMQWMAGETDEDHAAAVAYNLYAYESTKWKMRNLNDEA